MDAAAYETEQGGMQGGSKAGRQRVRGKENEGEGGGSGLHLYCSVHEQCGNGVGTRQKMYQIAEQKRPVLCYSKVHTADNINDAMTDLILPALPLGDPGSIFEPPQWPIPDSSRLSRIRAFDLAKAAHDTPAPVRRGTTPVLAKHVLDGDVPTTSFSSRSDVAPTNLFPDSPKQPCSNERGQDSSEQRDVVQQIDHKVAKMMQIYLMSRPSWAECTPGNQSFLPPSGQTLSPAPSSSEDASDESCLDDDESGARISCFVLVCFFLSADCLLLAVHTPRYDDEESMEVTMYRRETGGTKLVDVLYEVEKRWRTSRLFTVWGHVTLEKRRQLILQRSVSSWLHLVVVIKLARKKADEGEKSQMSACEEREIDEEVCPCHTCCSWFLALTQSASAACPSSVLLPKSCKGTAGLSACLASSSVQEKVS